MTWAGRRRTSPRKSYAGGGRGRGPRERHAAHVAQAGADRSLARSAIHDVMSVPAGPPCGGLYLKPPSVGGLCEGVTTMPSARLPSSSAAPLSRRIACETAGVGVYPSRLSTSTLDVVRGQHLQGGGPGGLGEPVRVAAHEQRARDALLAPVVDDRLGRRDDVCLGERTGQAGAAVPGRCRTRPAGRGRRRRARSCSRRSPGAGRRRDPLAARAVPLARLPCRAPFLPRSGVCCPSRPRSFPVARMPARYRDPLWTRAG